MTNATPAEVLAAVGDLLPTLRDRAQDTEDLRRIPDESIKSLQETGFFRLLQPARYSGYEASPVDFYRAVRLIASACGSTGWVSSVIGVHPWQLGIFDDRAQQEVWGEDPGTLISSSYAPMGRATAGRRWVHVHRPVDVSRPAATTLSGSSSAASSWATEGTPVDFRTFLLPRSDYEIEDVWDTIGLRGTGSNDIIVKDVFVPEYRTLSFMDTGRCFGPGQAVNTGPLYKLPFASVFSCSIAVPVLGMAQGAYDAYVSWTKERVRASTGGKAADDSFNQMRIADSAAQIDSAVLQIERNIEEELDHVAKGEKIPTALRVRVRRDQVNATGAGIAAVDRLFESAGGRALRSGTPIQRFWRDAHAGRVHAINDPEKVRVMYGQYELGIKIQDAWL